MSSEHHQHLSRRQRQIMDILYQLGEADARDVQAHLPDPPSYSAVRAMLAKLEEAGHVTHHEQGAKYIFAAKLTKPTATRNAIGKLIKTFFSGSHLNAATALLDEHANDMSDEELKALEKRIRQARKERSEKKR